MFDRHLGAHTKYRQLVDLAILLGEEAERFCGHILINGIDVAKEWHSRRAGDRDSHGAAKSVGRRGGWSDLVQSGSSYIQADPLQGGLRIS